MRPNTIQDFHTKYKIMPSGCWEWQYALHPTGYGQFWFNNKNNIAHRFSYEIHIEEIPNGLFVCHHCDNRKCVNPDHLFLGTSDDNIKDKVLKNRQSRLKGINHGRAKLSEQQVLEIRNSNDIIINLSKKYNVSSSLISKIIHKKLWKHI